MTATDQDEAAERAAQELAKRLRPLVPPPLLVDALAFARRFMADMRVEHWKCIPPARPVELARHAGDPPNETYEAAKAAITRKDDQ